MRVARQWSFAGVNVFDSFDGQQDFLLVAEFDDARILQVLPGQLGRLLHRLVALLRHSRAVLLQPQNPQPLFQRALREIRYRFIPAVTKIYFSAPPRKIYEPKGGLHAKSQFSVVSSFLHNRNWFPARNAERYKNAGNDLIFIGLKILVCLFGDLVHLFSLFEKIY
jgi:hypothetical protein